VVVRSRSAVDVLMGQAVGLEVVMTIYGSKGVNSSCKNRCTFRTDMKLGISDDPGKQSDGTRTRC